VFPETIPNVHDGYVGFRCNTLQDFVNAIKSCETFKEPDYNSIRGYAMSEFSLDAVMIKYQKWFDNYLIPGGRGLSLKISLYVYLGTICRKRLFGQLCRLLYAPRRQRKYHQKKFLKTRLRN
jgi:hypothetical protein